MRHSRSTVFAIFTLIFICFIPMRSFGAQDAPKPTDQTSLEFSLPLDQGRLNVRDVLIRLNDGLGLPRCQSINQLNWSIDVQSILGQMQLRVFDRLTSNLITTSVQQDRVAVKINRAALEANLKRAGKTVDGWFADLTGGVQQQQARPLGLTYASKANPRMLTSDLKEVPQRMVVLVHGIDDPGFTWNDLIPALQKEGYSVARFTYANDGPISEAADLLAVSLAELKTAGVMRVDIVAHSMGGLVSRDVLTRSAYYRGDGAGSERYPSVDRLIMVGTPNHGSEMVRLRGVTEIGQDVYEMLSGNKPPSRSNFGDGSGEAGVDLLPESDFLRRLNERPLANHTRHMIIVGQWSPVSHDDVTSVIEKAQKLAESPESPQWLREFMSNKNQQTATALIAKAIEGVGDGCVSIESAKLNGVDDVVIVKANHMSMIVNLTKSESIPPAIPVILERLKNE